MFQLTVAVISSVLLAALAGASFFYGGAAFSGSTAKANVSSLVNQGQQIAGAAALFRTDNGGTTPTDIATQLVANDYLQSVPTPPTVGDRSEEHTSELQSLMRISYAVFRLQNKPSAHHATAPPSTPITTDTHPHTHQTPQTH